MLRIDFNVEYISWIFSGVTKNSADAENSTIVARGALFRENR